MPVTGSGAAHSLRPISAQVARGRPVLGSGVACGIRTRIAGLKVRRPCRLDERDGGVVKPSIHFGCVQGRASRRMWCLAARSPDQGRAHPASPTPWCDAESLGTPEVNRVVVKKEKNKKARDPVGCRASASRAWRVRVRRFPLPGGWNPRGDRTNRANKHEPPANPMHTRKHPIPSGGVGWQ